MDETQAPAELLIHQQATEGEDVGDIVVQATANSALNDIIHGVGGTGRISFTAPAANGITLKDNGDSTFTLTGVAPGEGEAAAIAVTFEDEGDPKKAGTVNVAVTGVLSPHAAVAAEQVRANAA